MQTRRIRPPFDPQPWRRELTAIIDAVARAPELDARALDRIVKRHPRPGGLFSKSEILSGYRAFGSTVATLDEEVFVARLRLRPVRTLSGVTPVTVLTKPFPCPGTCIFCPSDVRMPKSYLADEPGAQRAEDHHFDPYRQVWSRLDAYRAIGHPTEKVELIVLGGTWSFHPEPYQVWFVQRCFDAMNDFGAGLDRREQSAAAPADYRSLPALDGRTTSASYNRIVGAHLAAAHGKGLLHESERASWAVLADAQQRNETAGSRCVGLVLETRPDHVTDAEVLRLRRLGATKVQLGLQSLSDAVLAANRRGHDVAASRAAVRRLRAAGFKIHAHWMPNLKGSTAASDRRDYARLFDDPDFRPDELKLYPCLLVESAALVRDWERGTWKPYDDDTLAELLADCMQATPRWCRLTRVVRDFSSHDVAAGTHTANLREVAERRVRSRGGRLVEIRQREVRGGAIERGAVALRASVYATSTGEECFLEVVTPDDRLAGFARLSLPKARAVVDELRGSALLREVHVYGASLRLGARAEGAAQHAGLGRALVAEAARRAAIAGFGTLSVISAVGTRGWYRGQGFRDGALYQHLALEAPADR